MPKVCYFYAILQDIYKKFQPSIFSKLNLIIDIGNTQIKAAIFNAGIMLQLESSTETELLFAKDLLSRYNNVENVIVSSVREYPASLINYLKKKCDTVFFFNSELPIPLNNLYETKNTLGYDRLAACIGAFTKFQNQNILVVDAGTAITFDFVNEKAQYCGGCISPGINMRYKALHHFTSKLPQLSISNQFELIGKNTKDAISGGVQNGIIFEVDSYINKLKIDYPDLKVVLTGGDAPFLHRHIENKTVLDIDILLIGLNRILDFNSSDMPNN
ncbi:type III pantothenate kinase [Marinifilum sp. N1E240]|uniref:type III pantothenate kinase n=1 Tax=Marinifilum sp. N1E240 TaxID=2608082 RepID=UPI00128C2FB7|nr:type III pantothenate kinase [Marinifilum sp. N1E240]MPQ48618.1 type III pantothenate kinase [Marinifilum sp. N1E240]